MVFKIVKKHIDALDQIGLLKSGAPKDEYDIESQMISERITKYSTANNIASIIADVFNEMFMVEKNVSTFVRCAECIYRDLNNVC